MQHSLSNFWYFCTKSFSLYFRYDSDWIVTFGTAWLHWRLFFLFGKRQVSHHSTFRFSGQPILAFNSLSADTDMPSSLKFPYTCTWYSFSHGLADLPLNLFATSLLITLDTRPNYYRLQNLMNTFTCDIYKFQWLIFQPAIQLHKLLHILCSHYTNIQWVPLS